MDSARKTQSAFGCSSSGRSEAGCQLEPEQGLRFCSLHTGDLLRSGEAHSERVCVGESHSNKAQSSPGDRPPSIK
ncbi:hypothetical protein SRHO_G00314390 [Serrasalmus rhombeus]